MQYPRLMTPTGRYSLLTGVQPDALRGHDRLIVGQAGHMPAKFGMPQRAWHPIYDGTADSQAGSGTSSTRAAQPSDAFNWRR
jgi:hypothetical protein